MALLRFERFEDLIANDELHFNRADLFEQDKNEGIPPEDYVRHVLGVRQFHLEDERNLNHQMGSLAQLRESYYVVCWHLFEHEKLEMWEKFGKGGVAIRSRYDLLAAVMKGMPDRTYLGLMRYGEERLYQTGRMNVLQFINTKRKCFEGECEVRAIVECNDPLAGVNRHFDSNNFPHPRPLPANPRHVWVHEFKRRRIDVQNLVTGIVVSPFAEKKTLEATHQWVKAKNHSFEVRRSSLAVS